MSAKRTTKAKSADQEQAVKPNASHNFSTIVGHDLIKKIFNRMLETDTIPQSMIFSGTQNLGKESFAYALAKKINCKGDHSDNCECNSCLKIARGTHLDIIHIEPEGANNFIKIDSIRDFQERTYISPIEGKMKVVIIDQADRMHVPSANSILKILEEPYSHLNIILITSNINFLLPTIKSRCSIFNFQPIALDQIEQWLIKEHDCEQDKAKMISMLSEGRPGLALNLIKNIKDDYRKVIISELDSFLENGFPSLFKTASNIANTNKSLFDIQQILLLWFRDLAIRKGDDSSDAIIINKDCEDEIRKQESFFSEKALFNITKMLLEEIEQSQRMTNRYLTLESILLNIGEIRKRYFNIK